MHIKKTIKQDKASIIFQSICGMSFVFIIFILSYFLLNNGDYIESDRLKVLLPLFIFPAFLIIILIQNVGFRRFDAPKEVMDGNDSEFLRIHKSLLTNTIEQTVILILLSFSMSYSLPLEYLNFIYVIFALFMLGRVLFIYGYLKYPIYRALGFGITFMPLLFYCIFCFYKLFI